MATNRGDDSDERNGIDEDAGCQHLSLHGVLLEIYGIGLILIGESGIGKSECALDLITRGHKLVSDDSVRITKLGRRLEGSSPELTFEHLEIRGLGIISIRKLFGDAAVRRKIDIELCVELKRWDAVENIESIGLEVMEYDISGVSLQKFVLPTGPGRNLATLVETAVRMFILRREGFDAAQELIGKHNALVAP